jgi:5-formyltetrahydrofolate cyclo-ligase
MTSESVQKLKNDLRNQIRSKKVSGLSDLIVQKVLWRLKDYSVGRDNVVCGIYIPMYYEPNILAIVPHPGISFALPKIIDGNMEYVQFSQDVSTNKHFKLLLEPSSQAVLKPDIIFVPGMAFDKMGYRLGLGKGHYDKYLSTNPGVYSIGICFRQNIFQKLPIEPHDHRMDEVITD